MRRRFLALAAVTLAGCTMSSDILEGKKIDYKSAGTLPSLEIPPDLTTPVRDNRFVVPETGKTAATLSDYQSDRARRPAGGTPRRGSSASHRW